MSRPPPPVRADFRWNHAVPTRWMDNDAYGPVDNSADGHFVHVYVDRASMRPVAIADFVRDGLERIAAPA